jgi:hypothetical protein
MTEKYEALAAIYESPSDFEQRDLPAFAFDQAMLTALEIRQRLTIKLPITFAFTATRNPNRVLELLKMDFQTLAQFV